MDISERQLAVDKLNYSALQSGPANRVRAPAGTDWDYALVEWLKKAWLGHDPKVSIWPSIDGSRKEDSRRTNLGIKGPTLFQHLNLLLTSR